MSYMFFDELGVEPIAYVGVVSAKKLDVKDVIHYVFSGDKLNILTSYVCGRYINTPEDNRYINSIGLDNRIIQTPEGNCK